MKGSTSSEQPLEEQLVRLYRKALEEGMPLEELEDKINRHVERLEVSRNVEAKREKEKEKGIAKRIPKTIRTGAVILPFLFISIGLYLVGNAVMPILGYYVQSAPGIKRADNLIAPIPQSDVMDITPLIVSQVAGAVDANGLLQPTIINEELDYTNLANWFDSAVVSGLQASGEEVGEIEYTLDIPKLNINNANVKIGGTDLNKSLIAYPGTAKPGELGAPVIFGHSVLRQFYNPSEKNPRRYNSIFSTIMTLEPGDKIYVTYDGVKYTYVVQEKSEVKPEDVYILNQDYSSRRIKIVTCVPEGTYLRRGVITAQLVMEGE